MNKTLFGLALLSYNWEKNKKDIIDSYLPLLCTVIATNNLTKISRDGIQNNLTETYGLNIPLGAIETIFKRMSKNGLLTKSAGGEWLVEFEKVCNLTKDSKKDELNLAFDDLVSNLNAYSQNEFSLQFPKEEIEKALISFFKEHDLEIMFASNNGDSVLPKVKESKKAKYVIAKYVTELQTKSPSKFNLVLKLAKGYAIASLITYIDIQNYTGNLADVEIFLDAPIVFNLLGLNGDSNLNLAKELINILNSNGAKLKIFQVNYGEVIKTIQDAIKRLNTKNYEISKSSRILRTAVRENISAQQLQIKLNQLDSMLNGFSIKTLASPSLSKTEYKFQIDEVKLTETIEELYKKNEADKIPWYKSNQIERDVESISNIFKIRKQNLATSLKSSKAILLTSNEFIAYAAKKHERNEWEFRSNIPVCVTDIFLSTILWVNYPSKNENLNIKQLISECYNIIELDNRLLNKFYDDINRMHKEQTLTDEQFYLLSASNLTYSLLEKKTLNDADEYTDKTPSEILEDLQLEINEQLNIEKNKLSTIDSNIRKFSKLIGKSAFVIIAVVLIGVSLFFKAQNPILNTNTFNISIWTISGLIGVFGFLRWMEIIPTRTKVESTVDDFIFRKVKKILGGN